MLALAHAARAEPTAPAAPAAPTPTAAPQRTVIVTVSEASAPLPIDRLTEALASQLDELGVEVRLSTGTTSSPTETDVLAFVWIEGRDGALVVHFYEPAGASLRERRIPVGGTDGSSVEEVAIIVRSAASALLERAEARGASERAEPRGVAPAAASAPAPSGEPPPRAADPPAPRAERQRFQASIAYAATPYAAAAPWQHGVMGGLGWYPSARWLVGGAYTVLPPLHHRSEGTSLVLARHPVELFVGFETPLGSPRASLRAEGALVLDPIRRETRSTSDGVEPTPAATRASWATSTRLRLAWKPGARVSLFAAGGADFLLNRFANVVGGAGEQTVLEPLRVRPRAQGGVAVDWR